MTKMDAMTRGLQASCEGLCQMSCKVSRPDAGQTCNTLRHEVRAHVCIERRVGVLESDGCPPFRSLVQWARAREPSDDVAVCVRQGVYCEWNTETEVERLLTLVLHEQRI